MSDFIEVCKQWERMCNNSIIIDINNTTCVKCAMSVANNGTQLTCRDFIQKHPDKAEKLIMDWAAEHPEPVYPTWEEWHDENFPDSDFFRICPKYFMRKECNGATCKKCRNQPIPADVAKKLGIKPKEIEK